VEKIGPPGGTGRQFSVQTPLFEALVNSLAQARFDFSGDWCQENATLVAVIEEANGNSNQGRRVETCQCSALSRLLGLNLEAAALPRYVKLM